MSKLTKHSTCVLDLFFRHRLANALHLFHHGGEFRALCALIHSSCNRSGRMLCAPACPTTDPRALRPAVRVDVMAVGIVTARDQHDRRAELKRADDKILVTAPAAHGTDDARVGRVLHRLTPRVIPPAYEHSYTQTSRSCSADRRPTPLRPAPSSPRRGSGAS